MRAATIVQGAEQVANNGNTGVLYRARRELCNTTQAVRPVTDKMGKSDQVQNMARVLYRDLQWCSRQ